MLIITFERTRSNPLSYAATAYAALFPSSPLRTEPSSSLSRPSVESSPCPLLLPLHDTFPRDILTVPSYAVPIGHVMPFVRRPSF